ncbi:MAG: ATP-binding protein [Planctomycetota bacterium]
MKRIIEKKMLEWVNSKRRKPLIIRGARQVGKTWLVENCLADSFEHFIRIDLEKQTQLHAAFSGELSPLRIIDELESYVGRIIPGKMLLFIDEIQACPRAITALRYFYEEMPQLHVVAAGSMLEFAFGEISVPVGRVQYLHISPMTFYEYLLAMNKEVLAEKLLKHPREHSEVVGRAINEQLKNYIFVGGMPEAVKAYRDTHSKLEAYEIHSEILESYREDFSQYCPHLNPAFLDGVFEGASKAIGQQVKYTKLYSEASGVTNRKAFDLLCRTKLLHRIQSCDPSGLPLGASCGKKFKTCMLDIGLLGRLSNMDVAAEWNQENLLAIYRGRLAEQFVAQELLAWHSRKLYYWSRNAKNSNAEVDYLIVHKGSIYPIEVKSGPAGRLKSLHMCLGKYPNCPQGWVLQDGPYRELPEQKLIFWPLYATPQLGNREQLLL